MSVTVDVELEHRIAELVAARRPVLEQLVRDAVDRELVALVDRELDLALQRLASRDGGPEPEPPTGSAEVGTNVQNFGHGEPPPCSRCGAEPRLPGRTIGPACKADDDRAYQARRRERKTPPATVQATSPDDDGPRAGAPA